MAERVEITCPACGQVYSSGVRGDDTHCPDPDCRANVYVRKDGTYRGQASVAAAVDVAPEASGELDEDLVDVVQLEAELEPVAAAAGGDLEDGHAGRGVDLVPWLCGLLIVGGITWAWWAQRRERLAPAPAAAGPVYGGLGWLG